MRILYVLNSGAPGGMETHVLDLVKASVESGNTVFVWCSSGPVKDWYKKAGAKVFTPKILLDIDPFYILGLSWFLITNRIDIIHAHEVKAVINSLIAGFLAGTKVKISHTHTPISEWKIPKAKRDLNVKTYTFFVNLMSSAEIALTQSRKKVKIGEGITESKIVILPNCISDKFNIQQEQRSVYRREILKKFNLPEDSFIIGNLGRLTEEKGHDVLLRAYGELIIKLHSGTYDIDKVSKVRLMLAGGGKLEPRVKEKIAALGLNDVVIVTGVFAESELLKYYCAFDMFVFPTLAEGFGIVLIEAMALGLPILCSDLEVLKEVGGLGVNYFKAGDDMAMSAGMMEIYTNMEAEKQKALENKFRVKKLFSFENFKQGYGNLYSYLLKEKNLRSN